MIRGVTRHVGSLKELALIAFPLLTALTISNVVLSTRLGATNPARLGGPSLDLLTPGFVSLIVLFALFYGLKRNGDQTARLLVAGITFAGTLSGLVLLQLWFEASIGLPTLFYVLAAPLSYLGLYGSFRIYAGSLSEERARLLMAVSTTLLGSLVGMLFPLTFTILLLLILSFLDIVVVESDLLRKSVGPASFDRVMSVTTFPVADLEVGVGDILAYSILMASSLRSLGVYAAGATLLLITGGAVITYQIVRSRFRVPGLPIPIWLGLVPSILGLLT